MVRGFNWQQILNNANGLRLVEEFAKGNISRDNMLSKVPCLRQVMRSRGVNETRVLARKALKRKNVNIYEKA